MRYRVLAKLDHEGRLAGPYFPLLAPTQRVRSQNRVHDAE
jgi:hypothetical protein